MCPILRPRGYWPILRVEWESKNWQLIVKILQICWAQGLIVANPDTVVCWDRYRNGIFGMACVVMGNE